MKPPAAKFQISASFTIRRGEAGCVSAAMPTVAIEDSTLERMTQSLLQISSTFLVQQNELEGVRERLQKELNRVSSIKDVLTQAAQDHQDAVRTRPLSGQRVSGSEPELRETRVAVNRPPHTSTALMRKDP